MADEMFVRAMDAMGDVQRRSVEAASALVERLVASVDGHAPHDDADADGEAPTTNGDTNDAIAAMTRMWRDSITSLASAVGVAPTGHTAPYIDVSAGVAPPTLHVTLDPDTGRGTTEVWLHNPTAAPLDKLRVHCGEPHAHDGAALDPMSLVADPDSFDLPPRSSRGIEISVDAPGATPGTYRTLVLVEGLPDQWMALEIVVPESA